MNIITSMELETFKFMIAVEIFLLSPDEKEVLLIHRSKDKEYLPDYYAGVGGKMDIPSLETPLQAAFREVKEEAFYEEDQIENFKLNGVITVRDRYGKWLVFEFVGKARSKHFAETKKIDEGVLEWVSIDKLGSLNLIQDLRNGILEKILNTEKFLWLQSLYDKDDILTDFKIET